MCTSVGKLLCSTTTSEANPHESRSYLILQTEYSADAGEELAPTRCHSPVGGSILLADEVDMHEARFVFGSELGILT